MNLKHAHHQNPAPGHLSGRAWLLANLLLMLTGCVTINIYFPAAAAEKAADRIIDEVWQLQQQNKNAKPEPAPESEQNEGNHNAKPEATPDAKTQ